MATNSDPIEQESFVYTSTTRTTKTTSSSSTQRQHSSAGAKRGRSGSGGAGGGKSRYRFRDSSLPRSAESGNTAPSSPSAPPWSWFRSADRTTLDDAPSQQQQQRQTMSGSTDRVNDSALAPSEELKGAISAGNGRQQQQGQAQQQASVVRRNQQQQQGKRVSLSQNDLQQQQLQQQQLARQHHDNNNNANNNGSKVRLLITPASTPTLPPMNAMTASKTTPTKQKYGSNRKQPQMVRSATATFETINSLPEQQLRSQSASQQQLQQQQQQQQQSRQRNYHHYDYYTDSDLASSLLLASQPAGSSYNNAAAAANNNYTNQNGSHCDENLLLFATEHNTNYNQRTNGNRQQQQPQVSHLLYGSSNSGVGGGSNRNLHGVVPTGKFVSSYPSWRQTQSSATGHHQNYSFHVPLNQGPLLSQHHQHYNHHQQQPIYQQSRYGFVAPASSSSGGGRFSNSRRSRTIGHLPGMVKVSVEDNSNTPTGDGGRNRATSSALATSSKERAQHLVISNGNESAIESRVDGSSNYEDFYEKPTISSMKQHMIMSEGDLLRVHVGDYNSAPFSAADYGFDNPFKPGTELSWEADMMVRLMKRGYPVKELPVLVETAKQVAREIGSPTHSQVDESRPANRSRNGSGGSGGSTSALANKGSETNNSNGNKQQVPRKQNQQETLQRQQSRQTAGGASNETFNERRQSSMDLRSGKQIWANSLSRAKSMPRFYPSQDDADSIDKLITSIENEMSDLLQHDNDDDLQRLRRRKSSGDKAATYAVGDHVDDSDNGTSGRPASSLAIITKVPSGVSKTKNKKRAASQEKQQVAVRANRKEIAGARKQQQQRRKGSGGSANGNQDKGDLNNKISRKHKRDFECCMIQ